MLVMLLTILPLAIFFIYDKANLSYSPFDMFTKNHEISKFREHFLQSRKSEGELSVVFNDLNFDINEIEEKLKKDPAIMGIFSEVDAKNEIQLLPKELHSLLFEDFKSTGLGKLFISKDSKRIIVNIKSYDTKDIAVVVKRLQTICDKHCSIVSEVIVSKDYAVGILKTLYDSALTGFASIILLILWLVTSVEKKYTFPAIASTLWASFMLLIIVIVFQIKINVVTCVALSVLIGLAGDNIIQFLLLKKDTLSNSVEEIGEASAENFILMLLLSSTLFFSYFQTPRTLGLLMIIGIVLMFIGDLWILNGLTKLGSKDTKSK
jgi:hypothetical protein